MERFCKSKPTFVLMAGFPGAGKTTLANRLGRRLNWQVIDKDGIKAQYMREGLSDERAAWHAYEDSFARVSISLNIAKASVILDSSAMREFVWEAAKKLAHNSGADLKVLHCIVDNRVRMQRLQERKALISQQNVATYSIQSDPSQFRHLPGSIFYVNTRDLQEKSLAEIIEYVMR